MCTRGSLSVGKAAGGMKLATHLRGQRICGVIPPLPNTPSWHRDNFTFLNNDHKDIHGQGTQQHIN